MYRGTTWANVINFVMSHVPGAGSIVQPVDLQPSMLFLCTIAWLTLYNNTYQHWTSIKIIKTGHEHQYQSGQFLKSTGTFQESVNSPLIQKNIRATFKALFMLTDHTGQWTFWTLDFRNLQKSGHRWACCDDYEHKELDQSDVYVFYRLCTAYIRQYPAVYYKDSTMLY